MSKLLLSEHEAEQELEAAALRYEEHGRGLGQRFLDAVAATVDLIHSFPKLGQSVPYVPVDLSARRAPVARFPYHVVYLETPTTLWILAVAHDRQRPGYWLSRWSGEQSRGGEE